MRLVLAAFASALLLGGGSAVAAPQFAAPNPVQPGIAGPLVLVRGGCGLGFHRTRWRDRYGRWHLGCARNR